MPTSRALPNIMDCIIIPNTTCVTLNLTLPLPQDRGDVKYYPITNSQNDQVVRVLPRESNATICLNPGNVTFYITTDYDCGYTDDRIENCTVKVESKYVHVCMYEFLI